MTPLCLVHASAVEPSFSDLVLQHRPALYLTAVRLCRGDRASAQDLVQDVLERAVRHFSRLKALANPRGWLFTILRHRFVDRCRERRRMVLIDEIEVAAPEAEPLEPPAWAEISREELLSAVAQLSREFRVVYQLHALEDRPYAEVARLMGIPVATVGTRLVRARGKLRRILERRPRAA